jgi:hypothetical protein
VIGLYSKLYRYNQIRQLTRKIPLITSLIKKDSNLYKKVIKKLEKKITKTNKSTKYIKATKYVNTIETNHMYLSNLSHKFIRPIHSNSLFELNHFTSHTSKISGFKLQLSGRLSTHKRVEKTSTKL